MSRHDGVVEYQESDQDLFFFFSHINQGCIDVKSKVRGIIHIVPTGLPPRTPQNDMLSWYRKVRRPHITKVKASAYTSFSEFASFRVSEK